MTGSAPSYRMAGWLVLLMACVVIGCGSTDDQWVKKRETVYPVSGTITFEGEPLEGAVVMFRSTAKPLTAQAMTDEDGFYELRTYADRDGAVAGEHTVAVRKTQKVANQFALEEDDSGSSSGPSSRLQDLLPLEFAVPATSPLKATVKAEENTDVDFAL